MARSDIPDSDTPLALWLEAHGESTYKMAKDLAVDPSTAKGWADGRALPGLVEAFMIERWTGGGVPVASWLGTDLAMKRLNTKTFDWERWREQDRAAHVRYEEKKRGKAASKQD